MHDLDVPGADGPLALFLLGVGVGDPRDTGTWTFKATADDPERKLTAAESLWVLGASEATWRLSGRLFSMLIGTIDRQLDRVGSAASVLQAEAIVHRAWLQLGE